MKTVRSLLSILFFLQAILYMTAPVGAQTEVFSADLIAAVQNKDIPAVRKLLEADPKAIRAKDRDGDTLLHRAAVLEDTALVGLLLEKGANTHVFVPGTYTADIALLAKMRHHEEIAALITAWRSEHKPTKRP